MSPAHAALSASAWRRRTVLAALPGLAGMVGMAGVAFPAPAGPLAAQPQGSSGTLFIMGGAIKPSHHGLWEAMVQASREVTAGPAPATAPSWVVLPQASPSPAASGQRMAALLRGYGATAEVFTESPRDLPLLEAAHGVFLGGGDQQRLVDAFGPAHPVRLALHRLLARGGVAASSSAGAAVLSQTALLGLDDPFDALLRPLTAEELGSGFGLATAELVTDQHFLKRGRIARLVRALLQSGRPLGLGVEEDSAALVRGGVAQALGARGLLVVDASQARSTQKEPGQAALAATGLRLSYIDRGDAFDLSTRLLLPPATRQALPLGRAQGEPGFFGDILGDNIIVGALARAAEGPGRAATGLAWRPQQATAFEWRLTADHQTRAFGGPTRDDHSIERVHLSITPVRLAQPIYRPL
jgi:cyanophycinase